MKSLHQVSDCTYWHVLHSYATSKTASFHGLQPQISPPCENLGFFGLVRCCCLQLHDLPVFSLGVYRFSLWICRESTNSYIGVVADHTRLCPSSTYSFVKSLQLKFALPASLVRSSRAVQKWNTKWPFQHILSLNVKNGLRHDQKMCNMFTQQLLVRIYRC